eukprot:GHVL01041410.1.p1 GENE.GHVL01041410.1~~GHVL01041410.1.p1  ORF type:complete len:120 (-),score=28.24 GHVL01041410.1:202-561(-)
MGGPRGGVRGGHRGGVKNILIYFFTNSCHKIKALFTNKSILMTRAPFSETAELMIASKPTMAVSISFSLHSSLGGSFLKKFEILFKKNPLSRSNVSFPNFLVSTGNNPDETAVPIRFSG